MKNFPQDQLVKYKGPKEKNRLILCHWTILFSDKSGVTRFVVLRQIGVFGNFSKVWQNSDGLGQYIFLWGKFFIINKGHNCDILAPILDKPIGHTKHQCPNTQKRAGMYLQSAHEANFYRFQTSTKSFANYVLICLHAVTFKVPIW